MVYFEIRGGKLGDMAAQQQPGLPGGEAGHPLILVETTLRFIMSKKEAGLQMIRDGVVDVNSCGALRIRPLGWACYSLWLGGVKSLLQIGANAREAALDEPNAAAWVLLGAAARAEEFGMPPFGLSERRGPNRVNRGCVEVLNVLLQRDPELMDTLAIELPAPLLDALRQTASERGHSRIAYLIGRLPRPH
jgi:hypothetical protein